MTIFGIGWLWWLLGTVGIGGAAALFFLAPAVFGVVVRAVVQAVSYLLSTRWGCALLAAMLAFAVADIHRSMKDAAIWEERVAEFNRQQEARDQRIAEETRAAVEKEVEAAKKDDAAIDTTVSKTIEEFKHVEPVPALGNPFRVGDDACRLREIVGQAGCESQGGNGRVPTPRRRPDGASNNRRL